MNKPVDPVDEQDEDATIEEGVVVQPEEPDDDKDEDGDAD